MFGLSAFWSAVQHFAFLLLFILFFYLIIIFGLLQAESVNRVLEERSGRLPLHIAADFGQLEVMRYLIDTGADVNVRP